jgi:hypothetical protein
MTLKIAHCAALAAGLMAAQTLPAAAIECDGNFQIMRNGGRIATPYCQDTNVARVAREYGMRVSAEAVRQNPSVKERVCRFAGDDLRIRDACIGYRNEGGRQRF